MSLDASNSTIYTGEFRHGIDPKNRITIPSAWRSGEEQGFYVRINGTGSCIVVVSAEEHLKALALIDTLPDTSLRQRQDFKRQLSGATLSCSADKQGRMVLPPDFCSQIGFQGEAVFVGITDRFEIWHPARWAETKEATTASYLNLLNQLGL